MRGRSAAARVLGFACLVALAGACAQIIGLEPFSNGGAGGGGNAESSSRASTASGREVTGAGAGGSSDGGADGCSTCAPHVPGWKGPVALLTGREQPTCPLHWTAKASIFADAPASVTCGGCSCDVPEGSCAAKLTLCEGGCATNGSGGGSSCFDATVTSSDCQAQNLLAFLGYSVTEIDPTSAGTCAASGSPVAPSVKWGAIGVRCEPPSNAACGKGSACLTDFPSGSEACVWSDAIDGSACPPDYPRQKVFYEGGSYECTGPCTCGSAHDAKCDGVVSLGLYSAADCGGMVVSLVDDASCTEVPFAGHTTTVSSSFVPKDPGSCDVTTSATLVPGRTVLVCCR